jgi:hypothetical protein
MVQAERRARRAMKDIPGYEGLYAVTKNGRVWSRRRTDNHGHTRGCHWLRPDTDKDGYRHVVLCKVGRIRKWAVHTLVLLAYAGPRPLGYEGCHGDRNPSNNNTKNLRWGTRSDNVRDSVRHGTHVFQRPNHPHAEGNRNRNSKLTIAKAAKVRQLRNQGLTLRAIGDLFGITKQSIQAVVLGQTWKGTSSVYPKS